MQTANSAEQLLHKAEEIMIERGKQYDSTGQQKERSMGRIVAAFNCLYGTQLTEQHGWHFMLLLKLARQKDKPHADSMEDAIAYAALAGEAGFAEQQQQQPRPLVVAALTQQKQLLDAEAALAAADGRAEYWIGEAEQQKRAAEEYKQRLAGYEQLQDKLRCAEECLRLSIEARYDEIERNKKLLQQNEGLQKELDQANKELADVRGLCAARGEELECIRHNHATWAVRNRSQAI